MLQVISGKFYNKIDIEKRKQGVLYSNMSWVQPIETMLFTVTHLDFTKKFSPYFIEYIFTVGYSIIWFGFVFFIVGLLLPSIVSILTILYLINKYNQYFGK